MDPLKPFGPEVDALAISQVDSAELSDGLAPEAADSWLRLQRRFAWRPEDATEALRAGATPDQIVAHRETSSGLLPREDVGDSFKWMAGDPDGHLLDADRRRLVELEARVLPMTDRRYPECLAALPDAPPVLLVRGRIQSLDRPSIAIVGARAATRAGRGHARRLGRELAGHGFTIVSGLARGIDGEAHRGAIEAGGRTVAVLACGLDRIYPPEHRALAEEIADRGAVLSEMPLGTPPRRELFPLRNRIISGLCLGVIVVEARRRSGSLITVRHALNQGREVFVVPGASEGPFAEGSNQLLREGARAIRTAAEIVEDLGDAAAFVLEEQREAATARTSHRHCADPVQGRIMAILSDRPASRDELVACVELDPGRLARALLDLELAGRVVEERDGRFHLCWG
jgi:DNA processing protein